MTRALRLSDVTVVVLAGGLGTRLREAVPDRPKILAPVSGRPFLDHVLELLASQGAHRVVLALGYLAGQVEAHLAGSRIALPNLEISTSVEPEPQGTGGALALCRGLITGDPVLVMNGDTFVDADLAGFVEAWDGFDAEAALVAVEVPDAARYGRLDLSDDGRVQRFLEKDALGLGPAWINGGIYLLSLRLIDRLVAMGKSSLERDLLERLPAGSIAAWRHRGRFVDIGTPASLAQAAGIVEAG